MKLFVALGLLLLAGCSNFTHAAKTEESKAAPGAIKAVAAGKKFEMFEFIGSSGRPKSFDSFGLKSIRLTGSAFLWPDNEDKDEPDIPFLRKIATTTGLLTGDTIVLDIEHWDLHFNKDPDRAAKNMDRLIRMADTVKQLRPGSRVGFYSLVPLAEYNGAAAEVASSVPWRANNDRLKELAKHVDVVYPSLYTIYEDPAKWQRYAESTIDQARLYGKPVMCFLWPQFEEKHPSKPLEFMDAGYWRTMLETCYAKADGIVIWTPRGQKLVKPWDPTAPWWKETLKFIAEKGLK